jgi:hypothetical protein
MKSETRQAEGELLEFSSYDGTAGEVSEAEAETPAPEAALPEVEV